MILLEVEVEGKNTALEQKSFEIRDLYKNNSLLQSRLAAVTQELNLSEMKILTLEEEIVLKNENVMNLNSKLKTAEENESHAERRLQIMGAAFHPNKSEENKRNKDSINTKSETKIDATSDKGKYLILNFFVESNFEIDHYYFSGYYKNKEVMLCYLKVVTR